MHITELSLKHFRNHTTCTIHPQPGINFIVGPNGCGKTSILEAIFITSYLQSFRSCHAAQWIQDLACHSHLHVKLAPDHKAHTNTVEVKLTRNTPTSTVCKKTLLLNHQTMPSVSAYWKNKLLLPENKFFVVCFQPNQHYLLQHHAAHRRSYFDALWSRLQPEYLSALNGYYHALDERNAFLKQTSFLGKWDRPLLETLSCTLAGFANTIIGLRISWTKLTSHVLNAAYNSITKDIPWRSDALWQSFENSAAPVVSMRYQAHYTNSGTDGNDVILPYPWQYQSEYHGQALMKAYERAQEQELRMRTTTLGPHRDDWELTLHDKSIKTHASQGEMRSILLALCLAEIWLIRYTHQTVPIFMIDDLSSELDSCRKKNLLRLLEQERELQTLITTTDALQKHPICWNIS